MGCNPPALAVPWCPAIAASIKGVTPRLAEASASGNGTVFRGFRKVPKWGVAHFFCSAVTPVLVFVSICPRDTCGYMFRRSHILLRLPLKGSYSHNKVGPAPCFVPCSFQFFNDVPKTNNNSKPQVSDLCSVLKHGAPACSTSVRELAWGRSLIALLDWARYCHFRRVVYLKGVRKKVIFCQLLNKRRPCQFVRGYAGALFHMCGSGTSDAFVVNRYVCRWREAVLRPLSSSSCS